MDMPAAEASPALSATDAFRFGMRRLASGVSLITTVLDGARHGLVATAVTSLSAEPPSLLICVNKSASSHDHIGAAGRFCVNLLANDQQDVASVFSSSARRAERFVTGTWVTLETGAPALEGALASFDCLLEQAHSHYSHTIYIGRIVATRLAPAEPSPLIYLGGRYLNPVQ